MKPGLSQLLESGVVAVMRRLPKEHIHEIADALVAGGVTGLEVTVDSDDAFTSIRELRSRLDGHAIVGAGTVLDGETAVQAIQAGAQFIFAPTLDQGTIEAANRYNAIVIPGVFTPTEALQAKKWGADLVKIFPADAVGPAFIKALQGPLGQIQMMPTGGIDLDNIVDYMKAGAAAVGAGGSLLDKTLIGNQDWDGLRAHAEKFVATARSV
ncbi:2-dehydro-3-deoxyphosphogluconate aldolase/(4S)-4-hydroxy-2-oxoglutarate aldolase [Geomicrobium halophilum]|uniref:2-dehydro-3-deoxyphosphogluconate aldolase/(4S)-4-hydroxy-2-oxoglutarate aldolase n=1 Tax=Geomicrobium halophilum TaxID=549000 RepID=A0A841PYC5_9BACL|nr:bifunctional 4-hydroxy-2-oxoglutarate aldolase/2-dehydro-3-deoxy-phosphogluconate aldolase [Geomicrobium halophilum]MBB6449633.1 2-dehydro-3-deoxyphosphogluconate aldolase/(4S)-4-hydroxy-2-oxoglutarate aldolase [Geomicrobium halophilum]